MIELKYDEKKKQGIIVSDKLNEIREHFSVKNEAAKFARRFSRYIPLRTYAITPTGRFEPSLLSELKKFFVEKQYTGELKIDDELLNEVIPASKWRSNTQYSEAIIPLSLPLRDYQEEIVKKAYKLGRGTIVLATSGRKTLTAASLLTNIFLLFGKDFKCLYIVPDLGLVEQTSNDFLNYKVPFSIQKWTGSNPIDTKLHYNVTVANLGILQSKNTDLSWVESIDCLIVDEVHKIRKGNEINKIIKKIKTPVRFGFTGTMPEDLMDQWNIIGKIGPILYEKNSYSLRLENYISHVTAVSFVVNYKTLPKYPDTLNNASDKYREEIKFIINNNFRNSFISKIIDRVNQNSLILVDYIDHGLILEKTLKDNIKNKQIFFIRGEVEVDEREKVKKLMEQNNNICVVAISKIFSTGINIKNLHYIVFAGGGKAKIKILQSIGRGLRLHIDKTKLIIFDIADNLNYGYQHFLKRKNLYEKENISHQIKEVQESY